MHFAACYDSKAHSVKDGYSLVVLTLSGEIGHLTCLMLPQKMTAELNNNCICENYFCNTSLSYRCFTTLLGII